jgi:aromatic ring-opening dioxygenase catalytic subunit (LigB family)
LHSLITSSAKPELCYDYFDEQAKDLPKEAWEITYPTKGDPELAKLIKERFDAAEYSAVLDGKRGWDHGTWVPTILLRPDEDLPCIQVSIPETANTVEDCIKYGQILGSAMKGIVFWEAARLLTTLRRLSLPSWVFLALLRSPTTGYLRMNWRELQQN